MFNQADNTMRTTISTFLLLLVCLVSCDSPSDNVRDSLDLSGEWMYALDPNNEGLSNNWSTSAFQETIELPGIPKIQASGPVWFSKKVSIPDLWKGKSVLFSVERTNHMMIWVDGKPAGESNLMFAPRNLDLTPWLTPGEHTLTLRIDRSPSGGNDPVLGSANTIMGNIRLEATSFTHITGMSITPNFDTKNIRIKLHITNPPKQEHLNLKISLQYVLGDLNVNAASSSYRVTSDSTITVNYAIRGRMPLWDEFSQPLIRVKAQVSDEKNTWVDALSRVYGLKSLGNGGTHFVINDQNSFLKGYVESGNFLQSSASFMNVETWKKRFEHLKQVGFNYCRFVSWCPPEAAFSAADKLGLYIQVDLPDQTPSVNAVISAFGHHPSFVFFSNPYRRSLTVPVNTQPLNQYPFISVKKTATTAEKDLSEATRKFATLCYRADIETAFRTPGLSGYLFMEYPSLVSEEPASWQQFNNSVVPLLVMDKRCWSQSELFHAAVAVANYSDKALTSTIKWSLSLPDGKIVKSGSVIKSLLNSGMVSNPGNIDFPLSEFNKPVKLNLTVLLDSTDFRNEYSIWVYPATTPSSSNSVMVSSLLNKVVMNQLEAGDNVLLLPTIRSVYSNSLPGSFFPGQLTSGTSPGTLGLFIQSKHPLFSDFPTESHANWQWMNIVSISRALNLSLLDSTYRPIVQVIDHPKRNLKLGLICEFKVGAGRLLVCTSKLFEIMDKPEAVQLYNSLLRYAQSDTFKPTYALEPEMLKRLISYTATPVN